MTCTSASKTLADYAVAWAPVLISATVAYIAWVQYSTNRAKLRLDLYNRRFNVYEMTLNYYLKFMGKDDPERSEAETEVRFIRAYRESMFLFGPSSNIYSTLTKFKDCMAFRTERAKKYGAEAVDPEVPKALNQVIAAQPDPEDLLNRLELELLPYLDFQKIERGSHR